MPTDPASNYWWPEEDSVITLVSKREQLRYQVMMKVTVDLSLLATCSLHKVACLLYDPIEKDIIKIGYCGAPHDDPHCTPDNRIQDGKHHLNCLHAEINALLKAGPLAKNAVLFCTLSPCRRCAIACKQAGIKEFVYLNEYHASDGTHDDMDFVRPYFQDSGIKLTWMSPSTRL